jgi:tRNA-2-methylthio-N6-dimethylallyladenosine synthase
MIQYDNIYAFAYSERPGTRASKIADDISENEKKRRLNLLLSHQLNISKNKYAAKIGKKFDILVEGLAKNQNLKQNQDGRVWTGRTGCNRVVNFYTISPRNFTNQFVPVKIINATSLSLHAELLM